MGLLKERIKKANKKKAEMGVGTLIVFIAMLLVAAVAAAVLLQTVGSLQEKSLSTGQQAKTQISTNAEVIEVSATDGRDTKLNDFQELMKLSPGSDAIKLSQVLLTFNTKDRTSTLKYRGINSKCHKNNTDGYNTWNEEELGEITNTTWTRLEEDLDDDGYDDFVKVNSTHIIFNLSSAGLINVSLDKDISNASGTSVTISINKSIQKGTTTYGYIYISGTTDTNNTLIASMNVTVTPYKLGQGYFAVIYEQEGTNHVEGNLQRGDMIKLCFESPQDISEAMEVRINFIPKIGTATLVDFVTPDVISTERVYLYP